MADCRVFRRVNRQVWMRMADGQPRFSREWVGICGTCGDVVSGRARYFSQATRKSVRDALYHHNRSKHQAGPDGTPSGVSGTCGSA